MDDLLDDIEREQNAAPPTTSTGNLDCQKQSEIRALSKNLLARMSGTSQAATLKRPSTDPMAEVTSKNDAIPPAAKRANIEYETNNKEGEDVEEDEQDFAKMMKKNKKILTYRIKTTDKNCNHEVCMPFDQEFAPLKINTGKPAKEFPFELDPFQKAAICCLDNSQSVLVSAHTSAGKTVVAIYAISLALQAKQRVIYTSPIKALSNQKYRELSDEFEDVGLMTGDVTVNPNASCIVMTTEILRSMLYRGTEIMREVGWVIFDEIHYMRDKERGVVWEETIILLPDTTHYVFLSATIPNATQFAEWICYLHHQPCNVVYTNMRPVPLQHLIFPAGGTGLYEVVDIKGNFLSDKFQQAMGFLVDSQPIGENVQPQRRSGGGGGDALNKSVVKIIETIQQRDMLPCIIFSFSRKECEMHASNVKKINFNTEEEKETIRLIYLNALNLLSEEDRKLPQIQNVLPFLVRGIGIHHSGQLPIMKEIVEILFGEGLIKTLFATETFAMGVNMPAKTVLFTSVRKFDGTINRPINSGEYIQMSGRAGRRGKDEKGLVISMMDQQMSAEQAQQLMKGNSDPLNSQFRLTYNMVLNLLRVPEINPEFMMEKSFYQWQNYSSLPSLFQAMKDKKADLNGLKIDQELEIEGYYNIEKRIQQLKKSIKEKVIRPSKLVPFFQQGRLLKMKHFEQDYDWGVLVNWKKVPNPLDPTSPEMLYIVEVGVLISLESERNLPNLSMIRAPAKGAPGILSILPFTFDCITAISTIKLKLAKDLKAREARESLGNSLAQAKKRFEGIIPELDPIEHMKMEDPSLKNDLAMLQQHEQRYNEHPIRARPDFDKIYREYQQKLKLADEYKAAKKKFDDGRKLLQIDELQCRKRVLRRLGFATEEDTITEKGRVACELSSADELLLTELIFAGTFSNLKPEEAAALLTCFVFEERAPNTKINDTMAPHFRSLQNHAKRIAQVCTESKLELNEEKYVEQFGAGMIDVVYKWCRGHTFAEIMKDTELFEGSIIRCMRRLDELLQEMNNAAKSMGDKAMEGMFERARVMLKRDIVFSASLYH